MEVTVTDLSPCRKQLRIEVDAETVDAKFDAVAKDFRRQAHLAAAADVSSISTCAPRILHL